MTNPTHVCGTIKPLVWEPHDHHECAKSEVGMYEVGVSADGYAWAQCDGPSMWEWDSGEDTRLLSLEAAKAAAQADYEARILAQIQPETEGQPIASSEAPYQGPIKKGMQFIWEADNPHARCHIVVTDIKHSSIYDPGGETWVVTKPISGGSASYNEESRFREAVRIEPQETPVSVPQPASSDKGDAQASEAGELVSRPGLLRNLTGAHSSRPLMNAHQKDAWDRAFSTARTIVRDLPAARAEAGEAIALTYRFLNEFMPKVNIAKSFLSSDHIALWVETETAVSDALRALTEAGE